MGTELIDIIVSNTGQHHQIEAGLSLLEVAEKLDLPLRNRPLGAFVNNRLRDLGFRIFMPKQVEFFDITHSAGIQMYTRALFFLMQKAVRDLLPGHRLEIEHSISRGYYCQIQDCPCHMNYDLICSIVARMRELVAQDLPFETCAMLTKEAIARFEKQGDVEKARFLRSRPKLYTTLYGLDGLWDYYLEGLVPSTSYLQQFDVVQYYQGLLLRVPQRNNPQELEPIVLQDKVFEIFREFKHWQEILDIEDAGSINEQILHGNARSLVMVCEALHEKKVAQIADMVARREPNVRIVLIAGPSSSGKTTFSKRLAIQLRVCGLTPHTIELDNYFVNRTKTPRDASGDYDFEALEALDVDQFNVDLLALLSGHTVKMPKYSFERGERYYDGSTLQLEPHGILIVEGIHGLNPLLIPRIPHDRVFKIYISALTSIALDGLQRISSSDNRLLRRMIRDAHFRSYRATQTIARWASVRRGEERNIFPFQEEADIIFNSALPYEFNMLKQQAEALLREVPSNTPEHAEACRLLRFLQVFTPIPEDLVPQASILREFLGGSAFDK